MNEPPALPPPESPADPVSPPPPEPPPKRDLRPWLVGAGFLVLAAGLVWVWWHPGGQADSARLDALARQLSMLEGRVDKLEQRPTPQPPDLGPLTARVAALEERPVAAAPPASSPDLGPLTDRVAALEQRPIAPAAAGPPQATPVPPAIDLSPIEARLAAVEARPAPDRQLGVRIDGLSARLESIESGQRSIQADLTRRLETDEARLATVERTAGSVVALAGRTDRIARIQRVQIALETGQPLGDIPDAPPALARFAKANPPTEAALRLAFRDAAHAALAAPRPPAQDKPLLSRMWAEMQEVVTVRQGDKVLIGDPAAGTLEHARLALDAGDLPGAVVAVGSLTGAAAQAMAGWLAEARALLDARAALAEWAAHA